MKKSKNILVLLIVACASIILGGAGAYYGNYKWGWFSKTVINKVEKKLRLWIME